MRSKLSLAAALCLALAVPAAAFGAAPTGTSNSETAVAYYPNADESSCLILTLSQGDQRPIGTAPLPYAGLVVQLSGYPCATSTTANGVSLTDSQYRVISLTAAYVDITGFTVAGHTLDINVSWVGIGPVSSCNEQFADSWWVAKCVPAHLSGTITDSHGDTWTADQPSALLRTHMLIMHN